MLIDKLGTKKNLLAFSGGVDSTSLFFILLENNISFDIAIINYNQREQATKEVEYAKKLAQEHNKTCYVKEYKYDKFSEKLARDFRYGFFDEVMEEEAYDTLITAHQLNDKLEWFMMQLARGAGVVELIGLEIFSKRKNYQVFRPLLKYTKDELETYLEKNNLQYFIDESNIDTKYQRNYIRLKYANEFVNEYKEGVKKSFQYLDNDIQSLSNLYTTKRLELFSYTTLKVDDENIKLRWVDQELKRRGILLSKETKDEIISQQEIVISNSIVVCIKGVHIYITPFIDVTMNKKFKEWCRINVIPKKIRPYLSTLDFDTLKKFIYQ